MDNLKTIRDELKDTVLTDLHNYEGTIIGELHHEFFNTDYYIIGRYQAEEWLKSHNLSPFEAIGIIKDYEQDNFGEVTTDISEVENVVNMLVYIIGEEVISNLFPYNEYDSNDELTLEIIKEVTI